MKNASNDSPPRLHLTGQSGLPKYMLLRNALVDCIAEGRWSPGEKLPSEDALVEMSALSLGTVQRSLRMLVEEGRLVRRHGAGTFVAEPQQPMGGPFHHFRFLAADGVSILPIYTKVHKRFTPREPGRWSEFIRSDRPVCIDRLFSIDREFQLYVQTYFDARRFPELASIDTAQLTGVSFKDLISRQYHEPTAAYTERLAICTLPDAVCKAIKVAPRTTGARLELVACDQRGEALYVQFAYIPPNERELLVQA